MAQHKILIVDDDQTLRDALKEALAHAGYTTLEASNGAEGLRMAESEHPDLILLDIQMPKMNGHEMLNEMRKTPWGTDIHVLLLTNADDPTNISQGIGLRSNDYIIKSNASLSDIVKRVKQHLAGYFD